MITKKIKTKLSLLIALLLVAMSCSLTGCMDSSPKKETNSDIEITTAEATSGTQKFSLNETAVFDSIKVTATEIKQSSGTEFFKPESGKTFVGVKFSIENISSDDQTISSLLLFDAYSDSVKCDYSISANSVFSDGTLDGTLSPGKKMVGYYAVEVDKNWKEISLEVKSSWLSNSKAEFVFENK